MLAALLRVEMGRRPLQHNLQGVPQGGVLSPLLFNLYMSKIPLPPADIKLSSYADDCSVLSSGPKIAPLCVKLNSYLEKLNKFFNERNLQLSAPKSTATLFTTCSQETNTKLSITIDGKDVPTEKNPKILGVYLDPLLNFGAHAKYVKDRVSKRNCILKALSGTSWGKDKETLITTYKAVGRSIVNYCAPIWAPTLSDTNWKSIQVAQNTALRTALGCVKMSDIGHLHSEAKMLKVKDHNTMLAKQFYLATKQEGHANFSIPYHQPSRVMKHSLSTLFEDDISHLFSPEGNSPAQHKTGLISIHSNTVEECLAKAEPSKVLGYAAPEVDKSEKALPRSTRSRLSQIRSGYSPHLNQYLNRINPTRYNPECPKCSMAPHDSRHLFNCPLNPTDLDITSLWNYPVEAAKFLQLETNDGVADDEDDGRQGDPG